MRGSVVATWALASACGRIGFAPLEGELFSECSGFANATLSSTMLANDRVVLAGGATSGTVSAICDAGAPTAWQTLAPVTAAAYGKPIVNATETGYADVNFDANGFVATWGFDR